MKKTLVMLILIIGTVSASFGQIFTQADLDAQKKYGLSNSIHGSYPVGDSLKEIWFAKINSIKMRAIALKKEGVDPGFLIRTNVANEVYAMNGDNISSNKYDFLPKGTYSLEFSVDTVNMQFSAFESIWSPVGTGSPSSSCAINAVFQFKKDTKGTGYLFEGTYRLYDYLNTDAGFMYVITKCRLETLHQVVSDDLDVRILEGKVAKNNKRKK